MVCLMILTMHRHIVGYGHFLLHGIVISLIIGLIVGAIARVIVPGRDPGGCLFTTALGLGGSLVGGFFAQLVLGRFHHAHWIASVLGAVILLVICHAASRRS
jgi:uncharacterized membrane protein YeaQ/YmgE (transglycosylase-associated protein family)